MRNLVVAVARIISLFIFSCAPTAWSANVAVTSNADAGPNTLRGALATANPGDTIVFALPAGSTITLASTLTVAKNLTIDGANTSGLTISGSNAVSALQINAGVAATISNLTIAQATTGIVNQGTLTVANCTLLGNANAGISTDDTLTVANSTLSGNAATLGGGIHIVSGSATITNNTFVNNSAHYGGGICSSSSSPSTATNNLFLGNTATQNGGSIDDPFGSITADHNLYWNNADASGPQGLNCDGCIGNTNAVYADPLLGPLANNGGPTQTYFPSPDSDAIDLGDDATCSAAPIDNLDQRGVVRPAGLHCDIGSVESHDRIFADGFGTNTIFYGFEICPDGWTLTGDWQCGVPQNVGPPTAFEGTQSIGTQIAGNYNNNDTWASTTATSPDIDITGLANPTLTFRMWIDTEGATYDGGNLQISIDGGATYSVVTSVTPAYSLTIAAEPAWGGHQGAFGWQPVQADLSAYAGHIIRLRFAFQSDSSGTFAGFYIDSVTVQ